MHSSHTPALLCPKRLNVPPLPEGGTWTSLQASSTQVLENPFVLSSAPPTATPERILRAFQAGWAGAVIKTLTWEPVKNMSNRFAVNKVGRNIFAFENIELLSEISPDKWFSGIKALKLRYPRRAVIGSIMADSRDKSPWVELALGCQDAGADMVELNFSCPHGYPEKGCGAAIGQHPEVASTITAWLKNEPQKIRTNARAALFVATSAPMMLSIWFLCEILIPNFCLPINAQNSGGRNSAPI